MFHRPHSISNSPITVARSPRVVDSSSSTEHIVHLHHYTFYSASCIADRPEELKNTSHFDFFVQFSIHGVHTSHQLFT
uniref:Uncharacterized protein n=1 Tax=Manihot esculenta TaxID=3983 RepID=A0A2C9VFY4_MANES